MTDPHELDPTTARLTGNDPGVDVYVIMHLAESVDEPFNIEEPILMGPFCCRHHAQRWVYMAEEHPSEDGTVALYRITSPFHPGPAFFARYAEDFSE